MAIFLIVSLFLSNARKCDLNSEVTLINNEELLFLVLTTCQQNIDKSKNQKLYMYVRLDILISVGTYSYLEFADSAELEWPGFYHETADSPLPAPSDAPAQTNLVPRAY